MSASGPAPESADKSGSTSAAGGHFARNVKWQFVANAAQALLGGAYLVVLSRLLGATDFGIFSIVTALVSVAGLLLELRIQDVVARDFCHGHARDAGAHIVDLFILDLLTRIIPCFGLAVLSHALVASSHLPTGSYSSIILAATGFLVSKSGWGVSTGVLRVLGRTDLIALCLTADWGLRLLLTVGCSMLFGMSVHMALVIALLAGGLCNLIQVMIASREFSVHIAPPSLAGWDVRGAVRRLRTTRRLLAANLGVSASDLMSKDLDVAMISSLLSADKVGLYKLAKSFAQMIWRGIDPFYLAIMPEVRRLWIQGNNSGLKTLLRKTSVRLLALAVTFVCLAYALVALFGQAILGAQYQRLPTLMLMMSLWVIICAPLVWGHPLAVAINRPELAVIGGVLGSAIGLIAFWTLTPTFGVSGAAIAWSLTTTIGFSFIATASLRLSKLPGSQD